MARRTEELPESKEIIPRQVAFRRAKDDVIDSHAAPATSASLTVGRITFEFSAEKGTVVVTQQPTADEINRHYRSYSPTQPCPTAKFELEV